MFLKNLRGVVNYAVPHIGSLLGTYFTLGHNLFRQVKLAEFMKHLQQFPDKMEDLSVEFDEISHEKSINVFAFLEHKPLKDLDSLLRQARFSSEVPQEQPNIIEGVPSLYLDLAANSLMHIQILISPESSNLVPINELQCQYLLGKLCDTLKGAKACIQDASLQRVQESQHTLKSLAQLAKEAEKLVHDCCDAEWIQAAMIFANAQEHFASLTFKLRLYMQLLQSIFQEGATKEFLTKLQDRKRIDDLKDEGFHFIDEKAKEDRQRLLSRLTEVGSSDSEKLIKRLEISSNRATFLKHNGSSVIEAWRVGYKSIRRV
ncbi:unnamed protein product [Sphagnum compactum]